jgi:hypothetical protein
VQGTVVFFETNPYAPITAATPSTSITSNRYSLVVRHGVRRARNLRLPPVKAPQNQFALSLELRTGTIVISGAGDGLRRGCDRDEFRAWSACEVEDVHAHMHIALSVHSRGGHRVRVEGRASQRLRSRPTLPGRNWQRPSSVALIPIHLGAVAREGRRYAATGSVLQMVPRCRPGLRTKAREPIANRAKSPPPMSPNIPPGVVDPSFLSAWLRRLLS